MTDLQKKEARKSEKFQIKYNKLKTEMEKVQETNNTLKEQVRVAAI